MKRRYALIAALVVGGTSPVFAQQAEARADSAAQQIVGSWEGTFESDHGTGSFRLIVARDTGWKVTAALDMGQEIATAISDFKVAGNTVTWTQSLMGMSCKASAVLAAGTLRGETNCGQGAIGYLLRKK
jgi:hypothetical protein